MNESSTPNDLAEQIALLRRQTFTLLLALVVVSGTLTVFLYRQASLTKRDITAIRPQAVQLIQAYNQEIPIIQGFARQLVAYGATHPDFEPIVKKYQLQSVTTNAPKK